jgi:hypothetical protein
MRLFHPKKNGLLSADSGIFFKHRWQLWLPLGWSWRTPEKMHHASRFSFGAPRCGVTRALSVLFS